MNREEPIHMRETMISLRLCPREIRRQTLAHRPCLSAPLREYTETALRTQWLACHKRKQKAISKVKTGV